MKSFVCIFLILVIMEEYHCDPCLDWLFGRRRNNNDSEKKLNVGLGFTAKTMISGQSEDGGGLSDRSRYQPKVPQYGYQSYRQNWLGYQPYYPPSYPSYRRPYSTLSGRRSFSTTYNIPYARKKASRIPQTTPHHQGSYGPHDRRYGTLYPKPFGKAQQTPNGAPYGAPSSPPNGTPAQTPVETGDGTPQRKQFFVTPTGIQETPAQPLENGS